MDLSDCTYPGTEQDIGLADVQLPEEVLREMEPQQEQLLQQGLREDPEAAPTVSQFPPEHERLLAQRLPTAFADAVTELYKAPARSPLRMLEVQRWLVTQLKERGVTDADVERCLPGAYRDKNWDVAAGPDLQPKLAISTKSIFRNIAGTVPNRLDDMLGEAANLHRARSKTVLGYLMILSDHDLAHPRAKVEDWFETCGQGLLRAAQRQGITDPAEQWEAACLICLDPSKPSHGRFHPGLGDLDAFLDRLMAQLHRRQPSP